PAGATADVHQRPRRFSAAGPGSRRVGPRWIGRGLAAVAGRSQPYATRFGEMAGQPRKPTDPAGHRQPCVDALFWSRVGRNGGGFWNAGFRTDAPGAVGLAGQPVSRPPAVDESAAPLDR